MESLPLSEPLGTGTRRPLRGHSHLPSTPEKQTIPEVLPNRCQLPGEKRDRKKTGDRWDDNLLSRVGKNGITLGAHHVEGGVVYQQPPSCSFQELVCLLM
ncbi:hypothetical protein AVEN_213010-1 [Araneus ventricosus]|uniref:Uncharacterized protein n=1 Tax=Araneus ventricosus TaxID=182803 RepID=A0A4Y2JTJ6_ARAVE|nr:hypothetical protein AVEN_213010-1 [Araneus ventricosus]